MGAHEGYYAWDIGLTTSKWTDHFRIWNLNGQIPLPPGNSGNCCGQGGKL